jgi:hypothetical protein
MEVLLQGACDRVGPRRGCLRGSSVVGRRWQERTSYEPKKGVQKSGGPTQSPGPLGLACIEAQLDNAAQASAHSVSRNHGEFDGFFFMKLNSLVWLMRRNDFASAARSKGTGFAMAAGRDGSSIEPLHSVWPRPLRQPGDPARFNQ